jgi:hypothetical protein
MNDLMKLNLELEPQQLDYDVWLPEHGLDYHTRTEFICGGCYDLAQQIHLLTGWKIYAEIEFSDCKEDGAEHFIHAWVVNDEGNAVDISGVHSGNWAKTKFSEDKPKGIIIEYPADNSFGYYSQWAKHITETMPNHFGIKECLILNKIDTYLDKFKLIYNKSKQENKII